ncbi:glycosyltransferase family 2 protein [Streptomyces sp. MI02-7b]|uniref:glycosyltransferase family 2 protein n=1 Tax=Streptomyces sp. MI02-7b TaxID=462941 RepID=UPI0029B36FF0|nr:glycosyltransferase family 2 protein [Streptomyces sp. MI02-7b]MDX3071856.1 glycosyltransferase family 2 protein [Streptomyces sp. MI02-7b]
MSTLSIVIPALNEAENLPHVFATIPLEELTSTGWAVEVIVADNGSTDGTGEIARSYGARVIHQPLRGYGNAYKAGIAAAAGDVIATGDADCTYPFDDLPRLLRIVDEHQVEFLNTNRLGRENRAAMKPSHAVANRALSLVSRVLFKSEIQDSQSGMWVFRRYIWETLKVTSDGMGFSQEIKNAAVREGFRCMEVPIEYRLRGGEVKLNALSDGVSNLAQLFRHRLRDNALRTETRAQWYDRSTRPEPLPLMPAQRAPEPYVMRGTEWGSVEAGRHTV